MTAKTSLKAMAADPSDSQVKKTDLWKVDPRRLTEIDGFNLRDLKTGPKGQAPVASRRSRFTAGRIAPATAPGTYEIFVSVGERDGTPVFALPLKDDDGQRRYRLGAITLQP